MTKATERSSRVGRKPVAIGDGIKVEITGQVLKVTGPKGSLDLTAPDEIALSQGEGTVILSSESTERRNRSLHGLTRSLVQNMITGVSQGFSKELEVNGVGYRASVKGRDLVLYLGRSHQDVFPIPEGIEISVGKDQRLVTVAGIDRQKVGEAAAAIRALRPPEPYKGKGIRYVGEYVRMKEGKAGK